MLWGWPRSVPPAMLPRLGLAANFNYTQQLCLNQHTLHQEGPLTTRSNISDNLTFSVPSGAEMLREQREAGTHTQRGLANVHEDLG